MAMSKKLELNEAFEIVQKSLGPVRPSGPFTFATILGDLLPDEVDRDHFRQTIRKSVQEIHFDIDTEAIPIFPHTTLKDLFQAIAMSALPGNPYIPKPDDEPSLLLQDRTTSKHCWMSRTKNTENLASS